MKRIIPRIKISNRRIAKFIYLLLFSVLIHSCVVQTQVYKTELESNFKEQKNLFIKQRGLEKDSSYNFAIFFSDDNIVKDYEVLSYNHVRSWIPLKNLVFKKWQKKYKLLQYLHQLYCTGMLESCDAIIVDADLNGVKIIRYLDSKKAGFKIPIEQNFTKAATLV